MKRKYLRFVLVFGLTIFSCVACVSSEFSRHYKAGASAANSGDFSTAITELETALKIDPNSSSLAWHKLAYCYSSVGRHMDAWVAIRKAVLLNTISTERKNAFYGSWRGMKQNITLGMSTLDINKHLGEPDMKATGANTETWLYALVALEFKNGKLTEIKE